MVENKEELELFKKFSDQLIAAKELIESQKLDNAKELYLMMLNTYNKIIDADYKEISFAHLTKLRQELEK